MDLPLECSFDHYTSQRPENISNGKENEMSYQEQCQHEPPEVTGEKFPFDKNKINELKGVIKAAYSLLSETEKGSLDLNRKQDQEIRA